MKVVGAMLFCCLSAETVRYRQDGQLFRNRVLAGDSGKRSDPQVRRSRAARSLRSELLRDHI